MKAMILAAGKGERLGEITRNTPKPLLDYRGLPLIVHRLLALRAAGIEEVVMNVWYHADQIQAALGDGRQWGLRIRYSIEETLLGTGGGIKQALPLLGEDSFIVISSDIITDFDHARLRSLSPGMLAHLVLVDNPRHHPAGDFVLENSLVGLKQEAQSTLTYANIAVLSPDLFAHTTEKIFPWPPLLNEAIEQQRVSGEYYAGEWVDVGRPADLHRVRALSK